MIRAIISDEQRRQRPKFARPFGLQRKSPPGASKGSTVLPGTIVAFLLPGRRFWLQRGPRGN